MSSSPATGPSAELIRYTHGSTRIGRTCTPCVTPVFPATRGSAHRPRTARIGCLACTRGNSSASPEEASATGRPASDPLTGGERPARTAARPVLRPPRPCPAPAPRRPSRPGAVPHRSGTVSATATRRAARDCRTAAAWTWPISPRPISPTAPGAGERSVPTGRPVSSRPRRPPRSRPVGRDSRARSRRAACSARRAHRRPLRPPPRRRRDLPAAWRPRRRSS
jgi:hypothetical protein